MKTLNDEMLHRAQLIFHPTRYKLLALMQERGPLYINKMARALGVQRQLVAFHLLSLEKAGLVEHQYKILKKPTGNAKGKAASFFQTTPILDHVLDQLQLAIMATKEK